MTARTHVIWDGHDITARFAVTSVDMYDPAQKASVQAISGRDGAVLKALRYGTNKISFRAVALDETRDARREALRELAGWLRVDGPRRLEFTRDNGRYWLAVPDGGRRRTSWLTADAVDLSFTVIDPAMYGEDRTVQVAAQTATVRVGGTYPTAVRIEASAASRDSSTGLWGVRVDGGDYLRAALASGTHSVSMDSASRVLKVDNTLAMPTLDSDWLDMVEPGEHTFQRELGTGAYTLSWTERWV